MTSSLQDPDLPLRNDIRLLGRLLGDVIRASEGAGVFDTIETVRRTAVRFRRDGNATDGRALEKRLKLLAADETNSVVRAFTYYLHLANIAEDRDQNRRRRATLLQQDAPRAAACRTPCPGCARRASATRACASCWTRR